MPPKTAPEQPTQTGTKKRVKNSLLLTLLKVVGSNGLRLLSNLILARLLFPEAFGLMALVNIFLIGLQTFSDIGINVAIIQNPRGEKQSFQNSAWSLQILRGCILWVGACLLAWPASQIYQQPALLQLLPVAGLTVLIHGFNSTKIPLANRRLQLGRVVALELVGQAIILTIMVAATFVFQSVWAIVFGSVVGNLIQMLMFHILLPGPSNRWHIEKSDVEEILRFGGYIFLSTIAGFLIQMGDRAILGARLDAATFGFYSIALMLGGLPRLLIGNISQRVLLPLYRMAPATESEKNRREIFKLRRLISLAAILMLTVLATIGITMIDFLYDARYALTGPMIALFCMREVSIVVTNGAEHSILAQGDSRRFFYVQALTGVSQILVVFWGVANFGIPGAILGPGLAQILIYPWRSYFLIRYKTWDPLGEISIIVLGLILTGLACYHQWEEISVLF